MRAPLTDDLVLEASNVGEVLRIAANEGVVTVQGQMNARNGLTVKGGRGGSPPELRSCDS